MMPRVVKLCKLNGIVMLPHQSASACCDATLQQLALVLTASLRAVVFDAAKGRVDAAKGCEDNLLRVGSGMGKWDPYLGGANHDGFVRREIDGVLSFSCIFNRAFAAMAVSHPLCFLYSQI
ncbi:Hypothetical predicted protein [Olea europaea subsp. europaea]|uniref:Uncharacterized protein n=1 Tax=Olea europaea subsp. europaea TaxID=158383 RepID=A0A8S0V8B6_OLEEU|nr:Hypothetical predicted protein [Olea europaea subsp. europaea]